MARLPCPYLRGQVELREGRRRHIAERHPDLLPEHGRLIAHTISESDQVRRSQQFGSARLFSRWYADVKGGKHVVVVVVTDPADSGRHWVITAYIARRLAEGGTEWKRS